MVLSPSARTTSSEGTTENEERKTAVQLKQKLRKPSRNQSKPREMQGNPREIHKDMGETHGKPNEKSRRSQNGKPGVKRLFPVLTP